MKILFDNGTPNTIARSLIGHEVTFARAGAWLGRVGEWRTNSTAPDAIASQHDKNIRYRQNLIGRKIALIVLGNSQWPMVRLHLNRIVPP